MCTSVRVSYFIKLGIVDAIFYRIPRLISGVLVRWPRALISFLFFRRNTGKGPRDIEVVYNHTDPSVAQAFGLAPLSPSTTNGHRQQHQGTSPAMLRSGAYHHRRPSLVYQGPLYSGHVHTIFNGLRPAWHRFDYDRHLVVAGDGQHLNLDVLLPSTIRRKPNGNNGKNGPSMGKSTTATIDHGDSNSGDGDVRGMFFVVPGLLNASTTNYVRNFAYQAALSNFAVAVLNYRGMGSTPLEVPRLFSITFTEDIRTILDNYFSPAQVREMVHQNNEKSGSNSAGMTPSPVGTGDGSSLPTAAAIPLIGVGFSLGGVALVKYISEQGLKAEQHEENAKKASARGTNGKTTSVHRAGQLTPAAMGACRLDAAIAVTAPFDPVGSDCATQRWEYRALYEKPFAIGFRKFVKHNQLMIEQLPNVNGKALFYGEPDDDDGGGGGGGADDSNTNNKISKSDESWNDSKAAMGNMKSRTNSTKKKKRRGPLIGTITSIRAFDALINASHNGYNSPSEYYAAAESIPWLRHNRTPCLCLSNSRDPVCGPPIPSADWASRVIHANPCVVYACMPVGGHLGFVGSPLAEVSGRANMMERFVIDCAECFTESIAGAGRSPGKV